MLRIAESWFCTGVGMNGWARSMSKDSLSRSSEDDVRVSHKVLKMMEDGTRSNAKMIEKPNTRPRPNSLVNYFRHSIVEFV